MDVSDRTVVYYSANTELASFEARVREDLARKVAAAGLPLISVTQIPIDLGDNVCVGRKHACDANAFRQLLIGARLATTPWILCAEADAIYPPGYFAFDPPDGRHEGAVHRYGDVWILGGHGPFRRKLWTEGAQAVWRETLIAALERTLAGRPEWSTLGDSKPPEIFRKRHWYTWSVAGEPVISCKTGFGLRPTCGTMSDVPPQEALPYWGEATAVRAWLWKGAPIPPTTPVNA